MKRNLTTVFLTRGLYNSIKAEVEAERLTFP